MLDELTGTGSQKRPSENDVQDAGMNAPAINEQAMGTDALRTENAELRSRLQEVEETLRAIRGGGVDGSSMSGGDGAQISASRNVDAEASRLRGEMLAQVSDAVIAIDNEERVTFLNPAAERQYGITAVEALGRRLGDLYEYRWMRPEDEAAAWTALAERGEWLGQNLHLTRDGRELHVESSVTMLRDAAGAPAGMVAAIRDVTAQRKTEALADSAHRQIESIINNTPAIVYALDLEERFLWANTALADLLKTTPGEMRGRRRHEFMPEKDADWHEANDRKVIEAGTAIEFEEQSQLPDRTIFWLTTKFPLRDAGGGIYGVAGISTDVTERKQAEEALRGRSEELQTLLDALPALVWISRDAECRVIVGNRAANELTRTAPGANLSQSVLASGEAPYLRQLKEDGTEYRPDELPLQRAIATGEAVRDAVLDFDFPDGRRVQALGTAVPLFDEAGRPRGGLAAFLDITARRQSEQELRERAGQLDLLARCSQRLIDCDAPGGELLAEIFGDIARLIGVESFYHFRADHAERCLHLETSGGLNEEERRLFATMKFGDLLCGRIAETHERIIVEDLQHSTQPGSEVLHAAGAQSYAGFPLLDTREQLLGTIAFISRTRTHFREGDVSSGRSSGADAADRRLARPSRHGRLRDGPPRGLARRRGALDAGAQAGVFHRRRGGPTTGARDAGDARCHRRNGRGESGARQRGVRPRGARFAARACGRAGRQRRGACRQ
ncbi:MAG: PAS domain-containing protein [Chthoniobacteraceae bacterium]